MATCISVMAQAIKCKSAVNDIYVDTLSKCLRLCNSTGTRSLELSANCGEYVRQQSYHSK
jgi:hypothetical protein